MSSVLPFMRVPDVAFTKQWYEQIGFRCFGVHEEPGCGLDWAMMGLDTEMFMLYPHLPGTIAHANDCGLYYYMESIGNMAARLQGKANIIEEVAETAYGRKEITFHDCNGFQITYSSEPD